MPLSNHTTRPQRMSRRATTLLAAVLLACIALGHEGRRVAQLALLAAPMLVWLAWPVHSAGVHRTRTAAVWLWAVAFALDGIVRGYLQHTYQAAPEGALVLGSAANSNARESAEYFSTQWRTMALWAALALGFSVLAGWCAMHGARRPADSPQAGQSRWVLAMACVLLLACTLGYASKPWRRLHPVLFWPNWVQSLQTLRGQWSDQQHTRDRALQRAQAAAPTLTQTGPATVVLVITDSINRDNLALYGYGRPTTPQLLAQQAQLGNQMLVLRNAWSVDASTLPAMRNMLNFGQPESDDPLHLLALARAAGYKVWWISNHDDMAIEQKHGRLADVVDMVNRTPGRASASLDSELLDCVQEALQDPAERKLVVVHLMGAHPHYSLRFPDGANPFQGSKDGVETDLIQAGRSAWVRKFRREYDAAVLYHDSIVAELLQMTRDTGAPQTYRAWMYLSDHGQEVGHVNDYAGHSPSTPAGYRIPAIIWRNQPPTPPSADLATRPFRADWAAWTLADLLNIQWTGQTLSRDVLAPGYQWQAPVLPVEVGSFAD
ncbi:heptose-I-phosphate ethanolaminephosphotransferase [Rhodoferax sp. OV413]|uniref:phosphoethanolamine transferase n=1 Tax=Rhodoferax sp. OV413 TaxID=1855285 RepID=UPI00088A90CF|nr:phosphoethanolamine transferase [Rhodoferax sp. OV413]SDP68829.1 heptose-I-phosphate ethanolaminephosphotransferase [Rhodoferax sp. OV413]